MLNIILNIIAIIVIVLSLFFINKISQQEKDIYKEINLMHSDIKDYSLAIDNTLDSFFELVQTNLNKMENLNIDNKTVKPEKEPYENNTDKLFSKKDQEFKNSNQTLYDEIISLKELGLTNEEIAKQLNKGIREVEITIKMWGNIKEKNID